MGGTMRIALNTDIEVTGSYDVVVCGGGVSGVPATPTLPRTADARSGREGTKTTS